MARALELLCLLKSQGVSSKVTVALVHPLRCIEGARVWEKLKSKEIFLSVDMKQALHVFVLHTNPASHYNIKLNKTREKNGMKINIYLKL